MFISFIILILLKLQIKTTISVYDEVTEGEYELIVEDLLQIHSKSNITYHSLWNRFGFNGYDLQGNRRRDIIDEWTQYPPIIVYFLYCDTGFHDCTEDSYNTKITIDIEQYGLGGNVSLWFVDECYLTVSGQSIPSLQSSCSFRGLNDVFVGNWRIRRENGKFGIYESSTAGAKATREASYFVLAAIYNETVCPCDCVYYEKVEAAKNVTREKKSKEELKEEMTPQLKEMEKNMTVDKSTLSRFINTKISKDDKRKASRQIGYVGILFLTLEISVLVILDLMSYRTHWEMFRGAWNAIIGRLFGCCRL